MLNYSGNQEDIINIIGELRQTYNHLFRSIFNKDLLMNMSISQAKIIYSKLLWMEVLLNNISETTYNSLKFNIKADQLLLL